MFSAQPWWMTNCMCSSMRFYLNWTSASHCCTAFPAHCKRLQRTHHPNYKHLALQVPHSLKQRFFCMLIIQRSITFYQLHLSTGASFRCPPMFSVSPILFFPHSSLHCPSLKPLPWINPKSYDQFSCSCFIHRTKSNPAALVHSEGPSCSACGPVPMIREDVRGCPSSCVPVTR